MATELMERTAIRMFEEDGAVYERLDDDCVGTTIPTNELLVRVQVLDHETEPPLLTIRMVDFVRFPEEMRDFAVSVCNDLNLKGIGKFVVDSYGDMSFRLDFPAMDTSGPDEFRHAMILAVSWFSQTYPVVMKTRWADMTLEQAVEAVTSKDDEDEDGGGSPIMTDEDIRNLLMGGGANDEDDE